MHVFPIYYTNETKLVREGKVRIFSSERASVLSFLCPFSLLLVVLNARQPQSCCTVIYASHHCRALSSIFHYHDLHFITMITIHFQFIF